MKKQAHDLSIRLLAREGRVVAILALYVDDFLIGTDSDNTEAWLIKEITKVFKCLPNITTVVRWRLVYFK